jgi:hypothetical protein
LILFIYSTFIIVLSAGFDLFGRVARADVIINNGERTLSLDNPGEDARWGTPPRTREAPAWQGWEQDLPYGVVPEVCVPWLPGRGGAHPPSHLRPRKPDRRPPGGGPRSELPAPQGGVATRGAGELLPELLAELVGGLAPAGVRVTPKAQRLSAVDKGSARSQGKPSLSGIPPTRGYTPPDTAERGAPERKVYPSQRPPQPGVNPAQPAYPGEKPPGPRK